MRWNVICRPLDFVCNSEKAVKLSLVEQIITVLRHPGTISLIKNPYAITEYIYSSKERINVINMNYITNKRAVKKAISRDYNLLLKTDILEYEDLISGMIGEIYLHHTRYLLVRILLTRGISNATRRKIFITDPNILESNIVRKYLISEDKDNDLLRFIMDNYLDNLMSTLHGNLVSWDRILLERILIEDLSLFYMVQNKVDFNTEILTRIIVEHIKNHSILGKTIDDIKYIIDYDNQVFTSLIKTLYKNGLGIQNSVLMSYLVNEYHELIDDEVANIVVALDLLKR